MNFYEHFVYWYTRICIKTRVVFFRIKMDFQDTVEDVYTLHKQLALVHYFATYKKQPIAYQHTPDPGDEIIYVPIINLRVFMLDMLQI